MENSDRNNETNIGSDVYEKNYSNNFNMYIIYIYYK